MKKRYLEDSLRYDALADRKMAFLSGPRQVGKTSLAEQILESRANYFNWDNTEFKKIWIQSPLKSIEKIESGPVVFDELHKYKLWKRSLKGLYDHVGKEIPMIVTGSARLDLYKKGGDSLLGRYIPYRLHPFTVAESGGKQPTPDALDKRPVTYPLKDLMACSGFPEPLLRGSKGKALRWSRLRLEQLVREDIYDLRKVHDLEQIKLLVELLPDRAGSPLSLNNLREDLEVAYPTIRYWMSALKNLYICFQVPPYSKRIERSLKKESKFYLYDWLGIRNPGNLLENIAAVHLQKACQFWTDTAQGEFDLYYIRTRDQQEIDFCVTRSKQPWMLVECKSGHGEISPMLRKIARLFPMAKAFQLTSDRVDKKIPGTSIRLMHTESFLSLFP